jgi:hypothetical protein
MNGQAIGDRARAKSYTAGMILLLLVAMVGVYHVKWSPSYQRVFVAAEQHSIGASIVSGTLAEPPPFSWAAAWTYAWAYGLAIWKAMVLGLVLGAGVQAVVPRDWLVRLFGRASFGRIVLAGFASVPGMM